MRLPLLASRIGLLALCLCLLTGCDPIIRTYGSHGNVEVHRAQLALLVEDFEASLARNQADQVRLSREAGPGVARASEQMANLVRVQEVVAAGQRERLEALKESSDYRELNEAYGAMITEQQMIADRYNDIVARMRPAADSASYVGNIVERARYVVVPPQYYRVNNRLRAGGLGATLPAPTGFGSSAPADTAAAAMPDTSVVTPAPAAADASAGADSLR